MNRDLVGGLVLCAIALAYGALALGLPGHGGEGPGPGFLPTLLAGGLLVLAGALVRDGWRKRRDASPDDAGQPAPPDPGSSGSRLPPSAQVAAVTVAYVPAFFFLGFLASTAFLVFLLARTLGERRVAVLGILAVGVPVVLYVLFGLGLGVSLPLAPMFP